MTEHKEGDFYYDRSTANIYQIIKGKWVQLHQRLIPEDLLNTIDSLLDEYYK